MTMQDVHSQGARQKGMSRSLTFLFAFAGAIAVGNLYWSQPLLAVIAQSFGVSQGTAGLLVTGTQIGYALGILLFVPLGDIVNRRRLIPAAMGASALALALCAVAPGFSMLLLSLGAVGLLTTGGQMMPPLAGDLASPEQRGNVVGTIASGMLTGILLSRTVSGLLAEAFGWQAVFVVAALATSAMAAMLWRFIPDDPARQNITYSALIGSVFNLVCRDAAVRATLAMGASTFATFTLFWTGLTFLLSAAPYNYSLAQIGLTGLAGLAGAVAAKNAGRLHDRGLAVPAQGAALAITLGCLVVAYFGATSIVVIVAVIILFDAAVQTVNVLNQVRLLSMAPEARSRMNSAFVTCNFIGGAVGSAIAGVAWSIADWFGLMVSASALVALALAIWLTWRGRFANSRPLV